MATLRYKRTMKKFLNIIFCAAFVVMFAGACSGQQKAASTVEEAISRTAETTPAPATQQDAEPSEIFNCASAGRWYPADAGGLDSLLTDALDAAKKDAPPKPDGKLVALIAPHAGYQFSAPVAAYSYQLLEGLQYDTVVVVGFSHRGGDQLVGVYPKGAFATPLGEIPIDEEATAALIASSPLIHENRDLFIQEHSLDNQLPFIQKTLRGFKLVPILIGIQTPENIDALAKGLAKTLKGKNALLVASSDMSHFWQYQEANRLDAEMINEIKSYDVEGVAGLMKPDPTGRRLCGYGAVQAVMKAARELGADSVTLLKYANSKDTFGDTGNGVVGYGAFAVTDSGAAREENSGKTEGGKIMKTDGTSGELTLDDRKQLLQIARDSLVSYIRDGKKINGASGNEDLKIKRGMFVTLEIGGRLRGCMGHFENDVPIDELAASQILMSATHDPRFPAVTTAELDNIDIEISVLSVPEPVDSYEDIEVGKHGVILEKNRRGATFLPQVAPEQGWDRATMLTQLSLKAGLSPDAWREGASFKVYTAEVFGEKE